MPAPKTTSCSSQASSTASSTEGELESTADVQGCPEKAEANQKRQERVNLQIFFFKSLNNIKNEEKQKRVK